MTLQDASIGAHTLESFIARLRLRAPRALFARREMRQELVSYDAMTPHASQAALDRIHWRPEIKWTIDRIHVLAPIAWRRSKDAEGRWQHQLADVDYIIEALCTAAEGGRNVNLEGHRAMAYRAAKRLPNGPVFLGQRDCLADVDLMKNTDDAPTSFYAGTQIDLGWMLHSLDHDDNHKPRYFRAIMQDGIIDVPDARSDIVVR